ncbi:unnamed protein product [Rotaria magnacalcarata]|uniref:PKD/REJ-like domain-containing protein n=1 Tax=Rotaria magnacalcarata TaxID=392030 RepID=A0A815P5T4_9BILA|nr:unnamed protein product [Rotaria magnacalcarata]
MDSFLVECVSFHQPNLSACAYWNSNGITLTDNNTLGTWTQSLFVDINSKVYVAPYTKSNVLVWSNNSIDLTQNISGDWRWPLSLFVTRNNDIYVDNGWSGGVEKWTANTNSSVTVMTVSGQCSGLFVDSRNTVYCSMRSRHIVVAGLNNNNLTQPVTVAGNGTYGEAAHMLNQPYGIFVDSELNLYVADCGNDRVQMFKRDNSSGTTVAGKVIDLNYPLKCPVDVTLDANGYLFIVDRGNNRIIGSKRFGFYCVVGCLEGRGSKPAQLYRPTTIAFDSYGNIFVSDVGNNRIQKFNLENNTCGCGYADISMSTGISTPTTPLPVRRSQDFYISATINRNCEDLLMTTNWTIANCTDGCSSWGPLPDLIHKRANELLVRARALEYGLYGFKLTVTILENTPISKSEIVYVKVNPSGITANLIELGTSLVTHGFQQDLILDPGNYSGDPDVDDDKLNANVSLPTL